jgi:sulfotransferase
MQPNSPVGIAINRVNDAVKRGHQKKMHFVEFNDLTTEPETKMKEIYDFLGEPYFDHNFNHVEQVTQEDDSVHGFVNLHTIRPRVQPVKNDAKDVLGADLIAKIQSNR